MEDDLNTPLLGRKQTERPSAAASNGAFDIAHVADALVDEKRLVPALNEVDEDALHSYWRTSEHDLGGDNVLSGIETIDGARERARCDRVMFRRACRLLGLAFRKGCCCSVDGALLAFGIFVSLLGSLCGSAFFVLFPPVVKAIEDRQPGGFVAALIPVMIAAVAAAILIAFGIWIGQRLAIRLRSTLTRHLHFRYMEGNSFYRTVLLDKRIDNPDQRIVIDAKNFTDLFTGLLIGSLQTPGGILAPLLPMLVLGFLSFQVVGVYGIAACLVVFTLTGIVSHVLMARIVPHAFRSDRLEGDFRYAHVHLRQHAEAVTVLGGQDQQHRFVNWSFRRVLHNALRLAGKRLPLNVITRLSVNIVSMTATFVPAIIFFTVGFRRVHADRPNTPDENGTAFSSAFAYLSGFTGGLFSVFGFVQVFANFANFSNRLGEMLEVMDDVAAQGEIHIYQLANSSDALMVGNTQDADYIELHNVTCVTPENVELVRSLSFRLEHGSSLLIMGPSGVGKSSILRVIGGLWPVSGAGTISRPAFIGRDGLFYLPQVPYLLFGGSLREQIVYPRMSTDMLTEPYLRTLLGQVGLAHLIELEARSIADGEPYVRWDTILSGGEKQRLSWARLFYHHPRFAILDECTSAVDEAMEDAFYAQCVALNISFISVAHSVRVRRYHRRVLLVKADHSYELFDNPADAPAAAGSVDPLLIELEPVHSSRPPGLRSPASLAINSDGARDAGTPSPSASELSLMRPDAAAQRPLTEEGAYAQTPLAAVPLERVAFTRNSVQQETLDRFWPFGSAVVAAALAVIQLSDKASKRSSVGMRLVRRVHRLISLMFHVPPGSPNYAVRLFVWSVVLSVVYAATAVLAPMLLSGLTNSVTSNDSAEFRLWLVIGGCFMIISPLASAVLIYLSAIVGIATRKRLTRFMHLRYFARSNLYEINCCDPLGTTDNPDQRIAEDGRSFPERLMILLFGNEQFAGLFFLLPSIVGLLVVAWPHVTYIGVLLALVLAVTSFTLTRLLAAALVALNFRQDRLEGDFRFRHVRLRDHAESVAFLAGQDTEHVNFNKALALALENSRQLAGRQFALNCFVMFNVYLGVLAGFILPGLLRFTGHLDWTNAQAQFLVVYINFNMLYTSLGAVLTLSDIAASLCGNGNRLGELIEALDLIDARGSRDAGSVRHADLVAMHHVSIATPAGRLLARNLDFTVQPGDSLFISGPSGAGKSSVLRTLLGLWPCASGYVERPERIGSRGIFFLPQEPLLVLGSLRDQIVYPLEGSKARLSPEEMRSILRLVRLEHLLDRTYAGSAAQPNGGQLLWQNLLSGGERQRLSFARVLYHQPSFVVLDECTSAVDEETENLMMGLLASQGMSLVSIAHRRNVAQFHSRELRLIGGGEWELVSLARAT